MKVSDVLINQFANFDMFDISNATVNVKIVHKFAKKVVPVNAITLTGSNYDDIYSSAESHNLSMLDVVSYECIVDTHTLNIIALGNTKIAITILGNDECSHLRRYNSWKDIPDKYRKLSINNIYTTTDEVVVELNP